MLLRFIGEDGSMGFQKGKTYKAKLYSSKEESWIWVAINATLIPYSSLRTLLENWQEVR